MKYRAAILLALGILLAGPARAGTSAAEAAKNDDAPCKLLKTVTCYEQVSGAVALVIKNFSCTDGTTPSSCFDGQGNTTVCSADCPVGTSTTPPEEPQP